MKTISAFIFFILVIPIFIDSNVNGQQLFLPKPDGNNLVGTSLLLFERKDSLQQGTNRQINVQLFYPAGQSQLKKISPYIYDVRLLTAMKKEAYLNLKDSVLNSGQD